MYHKLPSSAKVPFILFFLCALTNLIAEYSLNIGSKSLFSNDEYLLLLSKPLLMPFLLLFFLASTKQYKNIGEKKWLVLALIFANLGDILLLFSHKTTFGINENLLPSNEIFFLIGLAAFLLTHIFYIIAFQYLTPTSGFKWPPQLMISLVIFWLAFNYFFSLELDGILKPAVMVYSFIILIMILFAWRLKDNSPYIPAKKIWYGALLFLISDTIIGLNKFGQELLMIPMPSVIIMATYLAGQFLIISGAIDLIKTAKASTR